MLVNGEMDLWKKEFGNFQMELIIKDYFKIINQKDQENGYLIIVTQLMVNMFRLLKRNKNKIKKSKNNHK